MKYPMLPASAARRISIPALDGGVNGGNAAGRKNNQLADCENLWWQGGALRSRPGLAVRPETDFEDVLRLLDQTDGARAMIVLRGAPGFSGVKPVKDLLDRADRGGGLNTRELLTIADLLAAARRAKE